MASQFRNLIFEGGGVKGIAHLGAMRVLEKRGILRDIHRVGGSSAGAINALLLALGYSIPEAEQILQSTEFGEFMDSSFGVIRDVRRLARDFGWYKGDFFEGWMGDLVKAKMGSRRVTFGDIREEGQPEVYVVGTNLCTGFSEVFSAERHPGMPLVEAVRISMSIPLFFAAVRYGPREDVYVDGGVMLNYPVKLFDRLRYIEDAEAPGAARTTEYYREANIREAAACPGESPRVYNRQTLGLRLDSAREIALYRHEEAAAAKPVDNFTDYARALLQSLMNVQESVHLHSDDWQRTIYIDTLGVRMTEFHLSPGRREALLREGVRGAEGYFAWFDDPSQAPVNRVHVQEPVPAPRFGGS